MIRTINQRWWLVTTGVLFAFISACHSPQQEQCDEKIASPPSDRAYKSLKAESPQLVIGAVEHVRIGADGPLQEARVDTGATTTSVGYADLQHFERDGKQWVRFTIKDRHNGEVYVFEKPLVRTAEIKRHRAEPTRRPVVTIAVNIGNITRDIEVTLADRDAFEYPVLLGRNFINGKVLVDVSQRFVATRAADSSRSAKASHQDEH